MIVILAILLGLIYEGYDGLPALGNTRALLGGVLERAGTGCLAEAAATTTAATNAFDELVAIQAAIPNKTLRTRPIKNPVKINRTSGLANMFPVHLALIYLSASDEMRPVGNRSQREFRLTDKLRC